MNRDPFILSLDDDESVHLRDAEERVLSLDDDESINPHIAEELVLALDDDKEEGRSSRSGSSSYRVPNVDSQPLALPAQVPSRTPPAKSTLVPPRLKAPWLLQSPLLIALLLSLCVTVAVIPLGVSLVRSIGRRQETSVIPTETLPPPPSTAIPNAPTSNEVGSTSLSLIPRPGQNQQPLAVKRKEGSIFWIGSTTEDVLRAEGSPSEVHSYPRLEMEVWDYAAQNSTEPTQVEFNKGLVVRWRDPHKRLHIQDTGANQQIRTQYLKSPEKTIIASSMAAPKWSDYSNTATRGTVTKSWNERGEQYCAAVFADNNKPLPIGKTFVFRSDTAAGESPHFLGELRITYRGMVAVQGQCIGFAAIKGDVVLIVP